MATALEKSKLLNEQFYIKQHLYEKREARLLEADRQLGELQHVWAAAQEAGKQEISKLRKVC